MKYGCRRRVRPNIRHLAPPDGCACALEECVYGVRKSHELAHMFFYVVGLILKCLLLSCPHWTLILLKLIFSTSFNIDVYTFWLNVYFFSPASTSTNHKCTATSFSHTSATDDISHSRLATSLSQSNQPDVSSKTNDSRRISFPIQSSRTSKTDDQRFFYIIKQSSLICFACKTGTSTDGPCLRNRLSWSSMFSAGFKV